MFTGGIQRGAVAEWVTAQISQSRGPGLNPTNAVSNLGLLGQFVYPTLSESLGILLHICASGASEKDGSRSQTKEVFFYSSCLCLTSTSAGPDSAV